MKIITITSYESSDAEWKDWASPVQGASINLYSPRGFVRHAQLTNKGILIRRMDKIVAIPMDALIKIAEEVIPELKVPVQPEPTNAT